MTDSSAWHRQTTIVGAAEGGIPAGCSIRTAELVADGHRSHQRLRDHPVALDGALPTGAAANTVIDFHASTNLPMAVVVFLWLAGVVNELSRPIPRRAVLTLGGLLFIAGCDDGEQLARRPTPNGGELPGDSHATTPS